MTCPITVVFTSFHFVVALIFEYHLFPTLLVSDEGTVTAFMASSQKPVVRVRLNSKNFAHKDILGFP